MYQKLIDEMNEVIFLTAIERKLEKTIIMPEEVDFVRKLADKKCYRRAEYILEIMYIYGRGVEDDETIIMNYRVKKLLKRKF